jgi:hypothetical protein
VQRHRQPDVARIKVLFGRLWFLLLNVLAVAASLVVFGGTGITSAAVFLSIVLVATGIAFQFRQCQQRLRNK